jgi:hypothetical protein
VCLRSLINKDPVFILVMRAVSSTLGTTANEGKSAKTEQTLCIDSQRGDAPMN